jgi:predicted dienelactone hydrolase
VAAAARLIGFDFPRLSGSYAVGRANYDVVDGSRPETFGSDPKARRAFVMTVYYPAKPAANARPAPYAEGKIADQLASLAHVPGIAVGLIHSHAYEHVPVADGVFPVVLFSPGIGTPPVEYTALVEDLASRGYVVAALYPTYSVPMTLFTDGHAVTISQAGIRSENEPDGTSEEQTNKDRNAITEVWAADARFALDRLTTYNGDDHSNGNGNGDTGGNGGDALLKGHLDLHHVGMYGHSFGGATAAEVCREDPRFKACANLDGTAFSMTNGAQIAQPFLWMSSDYSQVTDAQLQQIHMTRSEFDAKMQERDKQRAPFISSLMQGYSFLLKGSTHSTYISDEALLGPVVPGLKDNLETIDGTRAVTIINAFVAAFFDKYLKQQDAPLLRDNGAVATYPEVELKRLGK